MRVYAIDQNGLHAIAAIDPEYPSGEEGFRQLLEQAFWEQMDENLRLAVIGGIINALTGHGTDERIKKMFSSVIC